MIDAVILFALMNSAFEFILLSFLRPRTRLRVLGSDTAKAICHIGFLLANLAIHWGTLIGTMSGVGSFIVSIVTVWAAEILWGKVIDDRWYVPGLVKYSPDELA